MASLLVVDTADYVFFGCAALFAVGFCVVFAPVTAWLNKLGGSSRPAVKKPEDSPK